MTCGRSMCSERVSSYAILKKESMYLQLAAYELKKYPIEFLATYANKRIDNKTATAIRGCPGVGLKANCNNINIVS